MVQNQAPWASEHGWFLLLRLDRRVHVSQTTRQTTYASTAEKVIYFIVTNIECDPPSTNNALNPSDVHLGLSAGELGCWIDSAVTRLTQTGLEHARVPDVSSFLCACAVIFTSWKNDPYFFLKVPRFLKEMIPRKATIAPIHNFLGCVKRR